MGEVLAWSGAPTEESTLKAELKKHNMLFEDPSRQRRFKFGLEKARKGFAPVEAPGVAGGGKGASRMAEHSKGCAKASGGKGGAAGRYVKGQKVEVYGQTTQAWWPALILQVLGDGKVEVQYFPQGTERRKTVVPAYDSLGVSYKVLHSKYQEARSEDERL